MSTGPSELELVVNADKLKKLVSSVDDVSKTVLSRDYVAKLLESVPKKDEFKNLLTEATKPISEEVKNYKEYLRGLPIAQTADRLTEINNSLRPAGAAWDTGLRGAKDGLQLIGDMPSAGKKIIPGVKSSEDLADLAEFSGRFKTNTRAAAKLIGAKRLRAVKVAYKAWEYFALEIKAFLILIGSVLTAVLWLVLTGFFQRRMRRVQ